VSVTRILALVIAFGCVATQARADRTEITVPPVGTLCLGDCDRDWQVTVAELVNAVDVVVGSTAAEDCPGLNLERVALPELIKAVTNALDPPCRFLVFDPAVFGPAR